MAPVTRQPRPRTPRDYEDLWHAIVDNSESCTWLGVQWRLDGISEQVDGTTLHGRPDHLGAVGGIRLGWDIANVLADDLGY